MPNRRELGYVSAGSTSTIAATTGYGVATGGTSSSITVGGQAYTLLTFTATGALTVTTAGLFDVLMFGGGGGGGGATNEGSGGGGAGGILQSTIYLDANKTITIGAGGVGELSSGAINASGNGTSLGNTHRDLSIAGGGAGGGNIDSYWYVHGFNGGSGGGGGHFGVGRAAVSGVSGYDGGTSPGNHGGGGGGAGGPGSNATTSVAGNGGVGYDVSAFIGGSALFKGGGGGGSSHPGGTAGSGGSSIGGNGGATAAGSAASANTASGGGAGGGTSTAKGGAGGSGIVYVRFKV